jgi:hypothetical protein
MKRILILGLLCLGLAGQALAQDPTPTPSPTPAPIGTDCDGATVCTGRDQNGILLTEGDDSLSIEAGARVKNSLGNGVDAMGGNDTIINRGSISSRVRGINGDAGNDRISNSGRIVDGDSGIYGGPGDDNLDNTGTIIAREGGIEGADISPDNDTISNSGTITVTSGQGIFTYGVVTNSGTVSSSGDAITARQINNSGRVVSQGGVGLAGTDEFDDVIINTGSARGSVHSIWGRAGNDQITNSGSLVGSLHGGFGDDVVTLSGGSISSVVDGGDGFDTLVMAFSVPTAQLADLQAQLAAADPQLGEITLNRQTYRWQYFEAIRVELKGR